MEPLTIEQKAKAYDEAVKKLKVLHDNWAMTQNRAAKEVEEIFPEFKESEDEKIKEQVIYAIDQLHVCECTKNKLLDWLEKQCGQKTICDEDTDILQRFSFYSYKDEPDILYLAGVYVNESNRNQGIGTKILDIADKISANIGCKCIRLKTTIDSDAEKLYRKNGYNTLKREGRTQIWLEKQCEQNQNHFELKAGHWYICHHAFCCRADHLTIKEGERFMCEKDGVAKGFVFKEPEKYFIEVCPPASIEDEQKPTDKIEPNTIWSEEDEQMLNRIIYDIISLKENSYCKTLCDEEIDWLKFIKYRVQHNQEYDDMAYEMAQAVLYDKLKNSLHHQSQWKPTDEQLHYLSWIANVKLGDGVVEQEVSKHLNELLEDLKKLKEK